MKSLSKGLEKHINTLLARYPVLNEIKQNILAAYFIMEEAYNRDKKLLLAGNGGSAADAEHIAGELMKSFHIPRPVTDEFANRLKSVNPELGSELVQNLERCLTAISLTTHEALTTAYINDVDGAGVFAQQLLGYGRPEDVFLGISTSGNSKNILNAVITAKALGIKTVGLTGGNGGELAEMADTVVIVPETETYRIQELHLPIYHCWCLMLEEHFFGKYIHQDG